MSDMEREFRIHLNSLIEWKDTEGEDFGVLCATFGDYSFNVWNGYYQVYLQEHLECVDDCDSLETAQAECIDYLVRRHFLFYKLGREFKPLLTVELSEGKYHLVSKECEGQSHSAT